MKGVPLPTATRLILKRSAVATTNRRKENPAMTQRKHETRRMIEVPSRTGLKLSKRQSVNSGVDARGPVREDAVGPASWGSAGI